MVKVMISKIQSKSKPSGANVGLYKMMDNYDVIDASMDDILDYAQAGHTIVPTVHNGTDKTIKMSNYGSQQLFLVDIDDGNKTMDDIVKTANEADLDVSMIYESFSSVEGNRRYRVGFLADKSIGDIGIRNSVNSALIHIMGADRVAISAGHIYYGTNHQSGWVNNNARPFDASEVANLAPMEKENPVKNRIKKVKATRDEGMSTPIVDALVRLDGDAFVGALKTNALREGYDIDWLFDPSTSELDPYKALHDIPMTVLAGVDSDGLFRCILPGHTDKTPSANIWATESKQMYKCFGCCQRALDGFAFIAKIVGKDKAKGFLEAHTALRFGGGGGNDKAKKVKELINSDTFKVEYPALTKSLKMTRGTADYLIDYAINRGAVEITNDGRLGFFVSTVHMADVLGGNRKSYERRINYLVALGFLDKLTDSEINGEYLSNSKSVQASRGIDSRINYYALPLEADYDQMDNIAQYLQDRGVTVSKITQVMVREILSNGIADKVYVQSKNEATDADMRYYDYVSDCALKDLEVKGYTTIRSISEAIRADGKYLSDSIISKNLTLVQEKEGLERGIKRDIRTAYGVAPDMLNGVINERHNTSIVYDPIAIEGLLEEAELSEFSKIEEEEEMELKTVDIKALINKKETEMDLEIRSLMTYVIDVIQGAEEPSIKYGSLIAQCVPIMAIDNGWDRMVELRRAVVDFLAPVQVEEVEEVVEEVVETLEDIGYQGAIDMLFGGSLGERIEIETAAEKAEDRARHNAIMDMVQDVQEAVEVAQEVQGSAEEEDEGVIVIDPIAMIQDLIPAEIKIKNKAIAEADRARNKRIDDQIINMFDSPAIKRRKNRKKDMRVKSSGTMRFDRSSKNKIKKVLEKMCINPGRHSNDYHRGRRQRATHIMSICHKLDTNIKKDLEKIVYMDREGRNNYYEAAKGTA